MVSGGNVDINILDRILDKGLQENGRLKEFSVTMADKPGQLIQLLQVIAETGANIFEVSHNRIAKGVAVSSVVVDVVVETRNQAHCEEMLQALKAKGYEVKYNSERNKTKFPPALQVEELPPLRNAGGIFL